MNKTRELIRICRATHLIAELTTIFVKRLDDEMFLKIGDYSTTKQDLEAASRD